MNYFGNKFIGLITRCIRRFLVGPSQQWVFNIPPQDWAPPLIKQTSLYLHVPFCRNCCPYCPYTKVQYDEKLVGPYTESALIEVKRWAEKIGPAEITSIYIGGGTPTLIIDSVKRILDLIRSKFCLTGEICIETNPNDINESMIKKLHDSDISLVSLGVQSFNPKHLRTIGRNYEPSIAERSLKLLADGGFASVNVDLMFALPGQTVSDVVDDLDKATRFGANQLTAYPLFTFPYTSIGKYLNLKSVRMPNLQIRKAHYQAISNWCKSHNFKRVSVWGFKSGSAPRYSSVTRDGYIGIGPGAGSHLPDGFIINTFDLKSWIAELKKEHSPIALSMPFTVEMSDWWWLYWRLYDTKIPLDLFNEYFGNRKRKALLLFKIMKFLKFAINNNGYLELTDSGSFWLHVAQNHFALNYINTVWTKAQNNPWPKNVNI